MGEEILGCFPLCYCLVTKAYLTLETPWTVAFQGLLTMGFYRQEYWSGLPLPSPGDLPDSGIEPTSPALAGGFFTTEPPGKPSFPLRFVQFQPLGNCFSFSKILNLGWF